MALWAPGSGYGTALELDRAVVGLFFPLDQAQERGLPGSVPAHAADLVAARDVQVDCAQDLGRAVALPEAGDRENGHRRGGASAA